MSKSEPQDTNVWPLPCSIWLCLAPQPQFMLLVPLLTTLSPHWPPFSFSKFWSSSVVRVICASCFLCLLLFGVVLQNSAWLSLSQSGISWPLSKITAPPFALCFFSSYQWFSECGLETNEGPQGPLQELHEAKTSFSVVDFFLSFFYDCVVECSRSYMTGDNAGDWIQKQKWKFSSPLLSQTLERSGRNVKHCHSSH